MFIVSWSASQHQVNRPIHTWRSALLLFSFGFLEDCAANLSYAANQEQATLEAKAKSLVSNKSYRVKGRTYFPLKTAAGYQEQGVASWYGAESGKRTASGVPFEPKKMTAAHKTLPLFAKVRVTNLRNDRYVDVVINDRGPFVDNKLIDLSEGAAKKIGMGGLTEVKIEYLGS